MTSWNKKAGIKGVIGNGYQDFQLWCAGIQARLRMQKAKDKPPITRTPFAEGELREQKYEQKKAWQNGEITDKEYIVWLFTRRYPTYKIQLEVGKETFKTVIEKLCKEYKGKKKDDEKISTET